MATLIIATVFLALFHFLYDGIILPSIRQHLRNKLFALRDKLRMEYINGLDKQDIEAFNLTHEAINNFVNRLPMLTITVRAEIEVAIKNDHKLKEKVNKRRAILESCQSAKIKEINESINKILLEAFIANSGGWLVYLIPVAVLLTIWQKLATDCRELVVVPHREIGKIMPRIDHSIPCM